MARQRLRTPTLDNYWDDALRIKPRDVLNSNFIGITILHVSGSLSAHHQEFLAAHRLWYTLCSCDEPFATRSRMERGTCRVVITIKLEFSASVGFIHKESVTMHSNTIVKYWDDVLLEQNER
jgi:hypothetical protein